MTRQLRSMVTSDGQLKLTIIDIPTPVPAADEVVIRVEAAPINPSDLGLLLGPAEMTAAKASGTSDYPIVSAPIPKPSLPALTARFDQSLAVGNEGAGVVIDTGSNNAAQALLGKTVAVLGREMYSEHRIVKADQCLLLPEGITPTEGASCFVNPLTVLGMLGTMRKEGHTALVHTAAASNLGQMLQKACTADNIELVNIVRKPEHVDLLRSIGARHICNSSAPSFINDLTSALIETGATLAFDAIGGGVLASQILTSMEAATLRNTKGFTRYGSTTHKQVYIYGGLDTSATKLQRNYGMAWGVGGWLLTPFLQSIGPVETEQLRQRVASELKTTFASDYVKEISLTEALDLENITAYNQRATGEKYLVNPNKGLD
tara:strand:- start:528 stop:1655 length:1128 start_codon:yes stop_codon:yes gene_type:complete